MIPSGLFSSRASVSKSKFAVKDNDEDFISYLKEELIRRPGAIRTPLKAKHAVVNRVEMQEAVKHTTSPSNFEVEKDEAVVIRKMAGRKSLGGRKYDKKEEAKKKTVVRMMAGDEDASCLSPGILNLES